MFKSLLPVLKIWFILQFMNIICIVAYIGGYQFMVFMARTQYTETGVLIDSGLDLNLEGGIAEYV